MDLNEVLIQAAKDGNMLVLKTALEKGADVNAKDNYGMSALIYALQNGHTEIANFLNEKGAKEERLLFKVKLSGKWGYIDRTGKSIIQPQFGGAEDFSRGLARVYVGPAPVFDANKLGYIDKNGKYVWEPSS